MSGLESQALLPPLARSCNECLDRLDNTIERLLAAPELPDDDDVMRHVSTCPRCMEIFSDIVEMTTRIERQRLQDGARNGSLLGRSPGLLGTWQRVLDFRSRLADHRGTV